MDTKRVLARPGTPTSKTCPLASSAVRSPSTTLCCPTICWPMDVLSASLTVAARSSSFKSWLLADVIVDEFIE